MGLRHALEADHLAAVASLSARAASPMALLRVAGAWGVGHGLAILAIACVWVATGVAVPEPAQPFVEAAAGLLLVWLGVDLLRERGGARTRLHAHPHGGGTVHAHLHWQRVGERPSDGQDPRTSASAGAAAPGTGRRSLHGLGGSALLGLLAARGANPGQAIAYAAVFGLGATAGMLALSRRSRFRCVRRTFALRRSARRAASRSRPFRSRSAPGSGARAAADRPFALRDFLRSGSAPLTAASVSTRSISMGIVNGRSAKAHELTE